MPMMNYEPTLFRLPEGGVWPGTEEEFPYVFSDPVAVAVDVALATNRPLLVAGPPGSGKSTLAVAMADILSSRYEHWTLTSRTRLEDLTGEVDQLERLQDANRPADPLLLEDKDYLKAGLFWRAFDPGSVPGDWGQGRSPDLDSDEQATEARPEAAGPPPLAVEAVILLDEIDKAEPDLPNDILELLDRRRFRVPQGPEISARGDARFLVVITTNGERELPPAFLRRCASLVLEPPDKKRLRVIADRHLRRDAELGQTQRTIDQKKLEQVTAHYLKARGLAGRSGRRPPGTSEYLDAIRAVRELKQPLDAKTWKLVMNAALTKAGGPAFDTPPPAAVPFDDDGLD